MLPAPVADARRGAFGATSLSCPELALTAAKAMLLLTGIPPKRSALAETADRVGCHFTVAYDWIHHFNTSGFATLEQVANPRAARQSCVPSNYAIPSKRPCRILRNGVCRSNWSVPKSAEYCRAKHLLPTVTDEWVRRTRGYSTRVSEQTLRRYEPYLRGPKGEPSVVRILPDAAPPR